MIKIHEGDFDIKNYLDKFPGDDPFVCRIASLFKAYRELIPFADFWVQLDKNKEAVAALSRLGTQFVLYLTDKADLEEIASFIRVAGATSLLMDGKYSLDLECKKETTGKIMRYIFPKPQLAENDRVISPKLKDVYNLLAENFSDNSNLPDCESFCLDISFKQRRNTSRVCGIEDNEGSLVSCAMTVAETESCAIIGAVATGKKYRNKGFGTYMTKYITSQLFREKKKIYLYREENKNEKFYNTAGYINCGTWKEIYF